MRKAWAITIFVGLALVGVAALAGGPAQVAVRALSAVAFIVAIVVRLRQDQKIERGPWLYLGAGGVMALASAITRIAHGAAIGEENPFPSYGEIPGYAGYLMLILAANTWWTLRTNRRDTEATLDGILVASALAVLIFTAVLSDYLRDASLSAWARGGNVVYTVLTLTIVGLVARLAIGPGTRNQSWRNLAIATLALVANDLFLLLDTTGSTWALDVSRSTSPIVFIFATASILHPGAHELTTAGSSHESRLTPARLAMLAGALLTLPAALLASLVRDTDPDLPVLVTGSVVLAGLSLTRIALLFRATEKMADTESSLTASGRDLLDASDEIEIAQALARTIENVVGRGTRFVARIDGGPGRRYSVSRIDRAGSAVVKPLPAGEMVDHTAELAIKSEDFRLVAFDLGEDAVYGKITLEVPVAHSHVLGLAVQTMAAQFSQALASFRFAESRFERRSEQRLNALVEQSSDVVAVVDESNKIVYVSPNSMGVLGVPASAIVGTHPLKIVHRDDAPVVMSRLAASSKSPDSPDVVECRLNVGDGTYRWFSITTRDFSDNPEVGGTVLTARDVTTERAAKIALQRSEQWFRGLVQNSSDVIAVLDGNGVFTYASPAVEDLTGRSPLKLKGTNFIDLLSSEYPEQLGLARRALESRPAGVSNLEIFIKCPDGTRRTAEVTITDRSDDPSVAGLVLNIRDVTDRKLLEEDLRHQVLHDDLTGLASRVQFTNLLSDALGPDRLAGCVVAALFIDIDDFKNINDSLGHSAGDQVLVEIGTRLLGRMRLQDKAARFGGDEFAVLLSDVSESDVTRIADRIVKELSEPVMLMGQKVQISVSVGIAMDQDGSQCPEDLLRSADVAMYEAKEQGKARWTMFEAGMADLTLERFEISNALGRAIENDELMVYYQPIVNLITGRTVGVEALVRWDHPVRRMVNPSAFIPVAERNGLIIPLGRAVLRKAVSQVAAWREEGLDLYVTVNVSAVQLQQEGIVADVLQIVDSAGMDRGAVVLELTESALIEDTALVVARIDALREAGLRVAIDDFGTGYSTLKYADEFSADILKIDRSFVAKLEDQDDSTIVSTILNIAEGLNAETVAEGIEGPDQLRRLVALGCTLGQGYFFARPAPADEIVTALVREFQGESFAG